MNSVVNDNTSSHYQSNIEQQQQQNNDSAIPIPAFLAQAFQKQQQQHVDWSLPTTSDRPQLPAILGGAGAMSIGPDLNLIQNGIANLSLQQQPIQIIHQHTQPGSQQQELTQEQQQQQQEEDLRIPSILTRGIFPFLAEEGEVQNNNNNNTNTQFTNDNPAKQITSGQQLNVQPYDVSYDPAYNLSNTNPNQNGQNLNQVFFENNTGFQQQQQNIITNPPTKNHDFFSVQQSPHLEQNLQYDAFKQSNDVFDAQLHNNTAQLPQLPRILQAVHQTQKISHLQQPAHHLNPPSTTLHDLIPTTDQSDYKTIYNTPVHGDTINNPVNFNMQQNNFNQQIQNQQNFCVSNNTTPQHDFHRQCGADLATRQYNNVPHTSNVPVNPHYRGRNQHNVNHQRDVNFPSLPVLLQNTHTNRLGEIDEGDGEYTDTRTTHQQHSGSRESRTTTSFLARTTYSCSQITAPKKTKLSAPQVNRLRTTTTTTTTIPPAVYSNARRFHQEPNHHHHTEALESSHRQRDTLGHYSKMHENTIREQQQHNTRAQQHRPAGAMTPSPPVDLSHGNKKNKNNEVTKINEQQPPPQQQPLQPLPPPPQQAMTNSPTLSTVSTVPIPRIFFSTKRLGDNGGSSSGGETNDLDLHHLNQLHGGQNLFAPTTTISTTTTNTTTHVPFHSNDTIVPSDVLLPTTNHNNNGLDDDDNHNNNLINGCEDDYERLSSSSTRLTLTGSKDEPLRITLSYASTASRRFDLFNPQLYATNGYNP